MKVEQRPADSKSKEALTDKASLLNLYREMLLIRRFEEKPPRCTSWQRSAASAT